MCQVATIHIQLPCSPASSSQYTYVIRDSGLLPRLCRLGEIPGKFTARGLSRGLYTFLTILYSSTIDALHFVYQILFRLFFCCTIFPQD